MLKILKDKRIRITVLGTVINIVLAIFKILCGIFGKSHALIADGFHSLSDLISDVVVILGIVMGGKSKDESHNYGHKKIETLSEIILGIILLLAGGTIGYNSATAIYYHDKYNPALITIFAAFISVVSKEYLYHKTIKVGKQERSNAVIANAWHHRSDALSSLAVMIGLIIVYAFNTLHVIDSFMGLLIAFIVIKIGFKITWEAIKKIIDTAPEAELQIKIHNVIEKNINVLNYHDIRMRYIGNELFIDMHIMVDPKLSIQKAHDIATQLKIQIMSQVTNIYDVLIHIEPLEELDKHIF